MYENTGVLAQFCTFVSVYNCNNMIRSLVIGLLSALVLPAMLACDKLPDPGQPRRE